MLKKWYNNQFEKINESPSPNVWDNLSQSLEEWPKHWYKKNTDDLGTSPRESTWQSIQSQIVNINYPAKTRPAYALISIATFLLIIIPMSLTDGHLGIPNSRDFKFATNSEKQNSQKFKASLNDATEQGTDVRNSALLNKPITTSLTSIPVSVKNEANEREVLTKTESKTDYKVYKLQPRKFQFDNLNSKSSNKLIIASYTYKSFNPKYSVGLYFTPQFSSHFNPLRTKLRASDNDEILNPVTVGFDLSLEKYISTKNSLRLNLRSNNIKSLKFVENNLAKEMTLNYLSLDLTYSRKWSLGSSDKLYLKTNIGIYGGYALSKGVNYNGERVAYIEDGLKSMDFGNSLGIVLSRKISERMRFEMSAFSQLGVTNIFKGTDALPSKYFRTSTISYGLSIGVIREF